MLPLFFGLALFSFEALRLGHSFPRLCAMIWRGAKKSAPVMIILILIGILTAMWHAGGTIPICVYYGLKALDPKFFILSAFMLSCSFAYAIGSCFGTSGTIGIVIMALARSGGVDPRVAAGAVLSGAFFGDRCAPASSSASLVAVLTGTKLYPNIRGMFRTALLPTVLSLLAYLFLSFLNPMKGGSAEAISELEAVFRLEPVMVLPVALILLLPPFGVDVKKAMLVSILAGALLSFFARGMPAGEILRAGLFGYEPAAEGRLAKILAGGGALSMARAVGTVCVASAYAGIFEETGMLDGIRNLTERLSKRVPLFVTTAAASAVTIMLACNQTLAVILTSQIMTPIYDRRGVPRQTLALDLEDTVILIAGLIPWSIAVAIPLTMMETDAAAIFYAVFLWLTPLTRRTAKG